MTRNESPLGRDGVSLDDVMALLADPCALSAVRLADLVKVTRLSKEALETRLKYSMEQCEIGLQSLEMSS